MKRIMVGLDGSAASTAAVRWSATLASATGAELVGLHAYRNPYAEVPVDEHERMLAERAQIIDQQWLRPAVEAGVRVRSQIVEGDPRRMLPATAQDGDVDLLVLGRGDQGVKPGFFHLGSVVEHIAHDARQPLAVIPADANRDQSRDRARAGRLDRSRGGHRVVPRDGERGRRPCRGGHGP